MLVLPFSIYIHINTRRGFSLCPIFLPFSVLFIYALLSFCVYNMFAFHEKKFVSRLEIVFGIVRLNVKINVRKNEYELCRFLFLHLPLHM